MKNFIMSAGVFTLIFVGTFLLISFAWVGAEYIIEDKVSFGTVDRIVAAMLTIYALNWMVSKDKKYRKRTEEENQPYKELSRPYGK